MTAIPPPPTAEKDERTDSPRQANQVGRFDESAVFRRVYGLLKAISPARSASSRRNSRRQEASFKVYSSPGSLDARSPPTTCDLHHTNAPTPPYARARFIIHSCR